MFIPRTSYCHLYPCLLFLVTSVVHIVGTIIWDFVFGGLVYFLSPIFPNWDIVNNIYTDFIYPRHLQHSIDINIATQTPILDYINYLRYLQQILKYFFTYCNFIVIIMSYHCNRQLNITKTTLTIFFHIFKNFITSRTPPLQLFFHASLLFLPSSNYKIIRHFIIIPYLFFVITLFVDSSHRFLIRCSLFITDNKPPFSLLLIAWKYDESSLIVFLSKQTPPLKRNLSLFNSYQLQTVGFIFGIHE